MPVWLSGAPLFRRRGLHFRNAPVNVGEGGSQLSPARFVRRVFELPNHFFASQLQGFDLSHLLPESKTPPGWLTGTYQVDITLPGFQSFSSRNIVVQQNSQVRVDAKLGVGALQETVLVSGTAAILQRCGRDPPRDRRRTSRR